MRLTFVLQIPPDEIFVAISPDEEDQDDDDVSSPGQSPRRRLKAHQRPRASSINPLASSVEQSIEKAVSNVMQKRRQHVIHTVFRYHVSKKKTSPTCVYVVGTMTNWDCVEMVALKDESDFIAIIDCLPGKYYYKFSVDGTWCHDESQSMLISAKDVGANVLTVKAEDREVFEALACDSFATRKTFDAKFHSESWNQVKPNYDELGPTAINPPFLPPHLLNKQNKSSTGSGSSSAVTVDSTSLLPVPTSHVMLHHLYAQSIKDHLLVLASTTRYRKKCVTIVYYTPID